jgi:hypothetical protein
MELLARHETRSRRPRRLLLVVALVAGGLSGFGVYEALSGGSKALGNVVEEQAPATVRPLGSTGLNRIVLSPQAAIRLGIETAPVHSELVRHVRRLIVPYSALIYGAEGAVWTYIRTKPLTFVRRALTVESIDGERALVSNGPSAGARVVTTGASELFGSEIEFEE